MLPLDSPPSVVVGGCNSAVLAAFRVKPKNENCHRTPVWGETRSIHPFYRQDPPDRFESSSIGLPTSCCGARVGLCGGCKVLGQVGSRSRWHPARGRAPTPPKPRRPGPDSGVGGVLAPLHFQKHGSPAPELPEVGSAPARIVSDQAGTWIWPKSSGCSKPRRAAGGGPLPTLQKPTGSGPKPLQFGSAHRRNVSVSSKPNHCRPPFPPWYWFGAVEFAPVGFPTLCCGARVGSCGHRTVLGRAEKRKLS